MTTRKALVVVARQVTRAIIIGISVALVIWAVTDWSLADAGAYWQAAIRLREGSPLYPAVTNVESSEVYRYAPWFAWLTVPLTLVPMWVASILWSAALIAASIVAIVPLMRQRSWLLALFFGAVLFGISAKGNVHALMLAWLVWGMERRSGPLWIAAAASLKAVPILFALVYLGRREWGRFAITVGLTIILLAPLLLYDLSHYVTTPGFAGLLINVPVIYVVAIAVGSVATIALARTRYGWLSSATVVALALPRFFVYDITLLLPGTLSVAPAVHAGRWAGVARAKDERPETLLKALP